MSRPGQWQAVHIYYAANPVPLLLSCVRPLVAELRAEGLVDGWFYINYWLEGPHVRLRLKPSSEAAEPEVRRRAEEAVDAFLAERPALYEVDSGFLNEFYNQLFDIEFSADERAGYLDDQGRMNVRPNNSRSWLPYEPEYGKYGGPAGIELAEWHFAHSSELVLDALRTKNLHLRTVLLGTSAQLMMVMSASFLRDEVRLVDFLNRYYEFWHRLFPDTGFITSEQYEKKADEVAPELARWFARVRAAEAGEEAPALPAFLARWAAHCRELRERVVALAESGQLVFRSWDGATDEPVTDPDEALERLLSPYMHMTNNRLHVTLQDEAYLAHVLGRALRGAPADAGPGR
ncbi:thiopeptide-type bacteriocin biosynthesis protein [Streptomyces sp. NBRC 109706]|uniref:thiopeptide-type bacteriocin biosynthesis protein n=1 Tax=Streptomyces sp. NBRC 109706 TaxID=1550035 RepID=UPI000782F70B|nr:thiopeptide-type bacteriocin biosynthesis protein [Streptomyces sp. NBRC 109706]